MYQLALQSCFTLVPHKTEQFSLISEPGRKEGRKEGGKEGRMKKERGRVNPLEYRVRCTTKAHIPECTVSKTGTLFFPEFYIFHVTSGHQCGSCSCHCELSPGRAEGCILQTILFTQNITHNLSLFLHLALSCFWPPHLLPEERLIRQLCYPPHQALVPKNTLLHKSVTPCMDATLVLLSANWVTFRGSPLLTKYLQCYDSNMLTWRWDFITFISKLLLRLMSWGQNF